MLARLAAFIVKGEWVVGRDVRGELAVLVRPWWTQPPWNRHGDLSRPVDFIKNVLALARPRKTAWLHVREKGLCPRETIFIA